VCSGAKTVPGRLSLPEIVPEYMVWNGLELIDLNSLRSASVARAENDGISQAGSHIFEAPSEGAPAGSAAPRWKTPTTPGRHIAGRQQLSPLPQDVCTRETNAAHH